MTRRPIQRRTLAHGIAASLAIVVVAAAEPTTKPSAFAHLPSKAHGPLWTFDSLAAAVPPGPSMEVDAKKPVPRVTDAAAAVRAAFDRLRLRDASGYDVAFRLAGATSTQTKDPTATKLLILLQHNGIGGRADASGALRTALDLVRAADADACEYVGREAPKSLWSTAKPVASVGQLRHLTAPTAVRLTLPITSDDGAALSVGGRANARGDDMPLPVTLRGQVDEIQPGRVVNLAGVWADGTFTAFSGDVPAPDVAYKWQLVRRAVLGGTWQVQTVKVTVQNRGVQPVKVARLKVRCYFNNAVGNDHTQTAECRKVAPGASVTVDVNFDNYNYEWIDGSTTPSIEVTTDSLEW